MKQSFTILMLCLAISSFSQSGRLQKEINQQVWKPFIEAFNNRDTQAYSTVHSKDFIRVLRDHDKIYGFNKAFKPQPDSIKKRWAVWKRTIELRFIERIASEDKAFEVGYYKTSNTNTSTDEKKINYGKFHVLLRKENGSWKILMDADGNEGVDETIFQTAEPMGQN